MQPIPDDTAVLASRPLLLPLLLLGLQHEQTPLETLMHPGAPQCATNPHCAPDQRACFATFLAARRGSASGSASTEASSSRLSSSE